MRFLFLITLFLILFTWGGFGFYSSIAITLWSFYVIELFQNVNERIAFREFILVLYGLNYLFSPALSYIYDQNSFYRMKIGEEEYFSIAIPCVLLLHLGMYAIKTKIFTLNFKTIQLQALLNQDVLVQWLFLGVILRLINTKLPGDLSFFVYLLSSIRFVAAYGLFVLDAKKYKWHLTALLIIESALALQQGMFHDLVIWLIFFGLFWIFIKKPDNKRKIIIGIAALFCFYILQITKAEYRSRTAGGQEQTGFNTFKESIAKNADSDGGLFNLTNFTNSVTRVNQAWILASTVKRMDQQQDFQQLSLMEKYAEAALLPRFMAPDKLQAGDKEIFSKFSGHTINKGTSMGLGFFADGYIAFGSFGAYLFAFLLGLIFTLIFKVVQNWSKISPFFILFIFPILNYAIRPDCETQTIMGHIVKSLFVFGLLMWYYKGYFNRRSRMMQGATIKGMEPRLLTS